MQEGSHDCGLFAVAYITSICNGQDPAVLLYKQNAMRKHILNSIKDRVMSVFTSSASRHSKASIRKNIPVYCILMMAPKCYVIFASSRTTEHLPTDKCAFASTVT